MRNKKHVIEISDDEDEDYNNYKPAHKRMKADGDGGANKKGKQRADQLEEEDPWAMNEKEAKGGENGWFYCNSDGELVIFDSPPKPKGTRSGAQTGQEPVGGSGQLQNDHELINGAAGGGHRRPTGAALAFAGGSSKAAQPVDPLDEAVETVCQIIPDVVPTHVRDLLRSNSGNVEQVLEALFSDPTYPKRGDKDKSGAEAVVDDNLDVGDEEDELVQKEGKVWMEVKNRKPGNRDYEAAALAQLYLDFPLVQQANIKRFFSDNSNFYAPTYVAAQQAMNQTEAQRGFKLMNPVKPRTSKGKTKVDEELEKEKKWVVENSDRFQSAEVRAQRLAKKHEEEIAAGNFFECGCCFTETPFSQIIICTDGCQFCKDCSLMNAESQIGMRKYILPCMSTSGCQATFPDSEIVKFLSRKSREALHKIRQEKEIESASIAGLEKCPFCPFALIIENDQERLFHCQRCKEISCRQCKKKDHLPKTCKEVSDDAKTNVLHAVEEAMSSALIRKCPNCSEPYIKENDTCNKIVCASCRTLSCYICSKVINGYEHFANAGSNAKNGSEAGATCPLWDDTGRRNFEEVEAARLAAEQIARDHPGISEEELNRLKAVAPPPPPARIAHLPPPVVPAFHLAGGAQDLPRADPPLVLPAAARRPPTPPTPPKQRADHAYVLMREQAARQREQAAREREQATRERIRAEQERRQRLREADLIAREQADRRRAEVLKRKQAADDAREARRKRTQGRS